MAKRKSLIEDSLLERIIGKDREKHGRSAGVRDILLTDVRIGNRHRKDLGDIGELAKSIEDIGLLHPIVVLPDFTLVAGERRLAAFRQLGQETIPARIIDTLADSAAVLRAERDENTARKDLTPLEMDSIAQALLPEAQQAAEQRRLSRLKKGDEISRSGIIPEREKGEAIDQVAAVVGVSGKTLKRIREVVEKGSPELIQAMDKGEISIAKAAAQVDQASEAKLLPPNNNRASLPTKQETISFHYSAAIKDGRTLNVTVIPEDAAPLTLKEIKEALKTALASIKV